MLIDDLTRDILDAAKPPADDQINEHFGSINQQLIGAAAALIKCRELIEKTPSLTLSTLETKTKSEIYKQTFFDLKRSVEENDTIDWGISDTLSLWSIGFFLNKAQHNIVSVLYRCVDTLLILKESKAEQEKGWREAPRESWLLPADISERLSQLKGNFTNKKEDSVIAQKIDGLLAGFQKYHIDPEISAEHIQKLVDELAYESKKPPLKELFFKIPEESAAEYIGIIFSRITASHLLIKGAYQERLYRADISLPIEWVVTTKAFIWLADFWKEATTKIELPLPPKMLYDLGSRWK
jgi:hypothetical protein